MRAMTTLDAARLWTPDGWRHDAALDIADGRIASIADVGPGSAASAAVPWVVPGIANLHSHAFQRAMAGMAERQTNPEDSF
jgi:formimidoylglutamate deiminase